MCSLVQMFCCSQALSLDNARKYIHTHIYIHLFFLYLSIYIEWVHTNTCNSEHKFHCRLIPLRICHFLLCWWEPGSNVLNILFVETSIYTYSPNLTTFPCGLGCSCHQPPLLLSWACVSPCFGHIKDESILKLHCVWYEGDSNLVFPAMNSVLGPVPQRCGEH